MEYLSEKLRRLKIDLRNGNSVRNSLPIKYYIQQRLAREIESLTSKYASVLEVGCGGSIAIHLLSLSGHHAVALDYADIALRFSGLLKDEFHSNTVVIHGDAFNLPFQNNSFDYVYSVGLIEHYHTAQQINIALEMARCSRRYIHIEVPNYKPTVRDKKYLTH